MNQESKFFKFIDKHGLTSGNILLIFFSFWITALAVRGTIFWLVYHNFIPAVFVRGFHIHHFVTGFLLLTAGLIIFSKKILSNFVPLVLIGCALALIFDEFLYWTRGHFNYWSLVNLAATLIIGGGMLAAYFSVKKNYSGGISKKRFIGISLLTILFSSCLFMLFHYDRLLNDVYQQNNPVKQEYSDPGAK